MYLPYISQYFLGKHTVSTLYVLYCKRKRYPNIFICVLNMNESLKGLEQHEDEYITELQFLGELTL